MSRAAATARSRRRAETMPLRVLLRYGAIGGIAKVVVGRQGAPV